MAWTPDPPVVNETLTMASPSTLAASQFFELLPGETAMIELLRTSGGVEAWRVQVLPSLDGVTASDTSGIRRIIEAGFLRPIFSQDSVGVKFFQVTISNADTVPSESHVADLRVIRDGVKLA